MRKIIAFITVFLTLSLLSLSVLAEGDFEIIDGELIKYSGSDSVVSVPSDVQNIKAGAFDGTPGVTCVIFNSLSCSFEQGALPAGALVKAPESSNAHLAALEYGLAFKALDGSVSITINYLYTSGETAYPTFTAEIFTGDSYSYPVPAIEGYAPNIKTVQGVAGDVDITVTVIYSLNEADGWVIKNGHAMYVSGGSYVVDTTVEIGGVPYSFDKSGNLIIASGFLNTPGGTYYFSNNVAVTGYRIIGKSIYLFNDDGTMVKSTSLGGYRFGADGKLQGSDVLVTMDGDVYFLVSNELFSGYKMINGSIMYFGADYKQAKSTTVNGYTFDASGSLSSGISADELEISAPSDAAYTGEALEPAVTVKFKGITLTKGVHYSLIYSDNTAPGEAKVIISGMGCVSGNTSRTFNIIGTVSYTLTIRYISVTGDIIADSYTALLEPGEKYEIPSPVIEGYEPDQESVSGTMANSNITVIVTYKQLEESSESDEPFPIDPTESTDEVSEPVDPDESNTESDITESDESDSSTESSDGINSNADSNNKDADRSGYKYDYALFIKVFIIATLIAGAAIVLILNWDRIKKALEKKNIKIFKSKNSKKENSKKENSSTK